MPVCAARFGFLLGGLALTALLTTGPALAQDASGTSAPPRLLKGSAIQPAASEPADRIYRLPGFDIAAGEDLWLIDAEAGELVACRLFNTSRVGEREIRCFADHLPRRLRN